MGSVDYPCGSMESGIMIKRYRTRPMAEERRSAALALQSLSEEEMESVAEIGETVEVSEPLLRFLVEFSENIQMSSNKMITCGLVKKAMDFLYKQKAPVTGLILDMLVNLTQHDSGVASFLQTGAEDSDEEVAAAEVAGEFSGEFVVEATGEVKKLWLFVLKLVNSFCIASTVDARVEEASFVKTDVSFVKVGPLLVNLAKSVEGRKFFLNPTRGLLKQIIQQYDPDSSLRKLLVSGTTDRNLEVHLLSMGFPSRCFGADELVLDFILNSDFLWIALLLPLTGKKVHNEQVDAPIIQIQALEIIRLVVLRDSGVRAFFNGLSVMDLGFEEEYENKVLQEYAQPISYVPLFRRLCSQLATVECLESLQFYRKASCLALDALRNIAFESLHYNEEVIVQRLKDKWIINDALDFFHELIKRREKNGDLRWKVRVLMLELQPKIMKYALSETPTRVFSLLEERYPKLLLYLQVRQVFDSFRYTMRHCYHIHQLFAIYGIPEIAPRFGFRGVIPGVVPYWW